MNKFRKIRPKLIHLLQNKKFTDESKQAVASKYNLCLLEFQSL